MTTSKKEQANALKEAMRQLPFPVAIATAAVGKQKRGITIGSFTSLSLDPPLISFNIDREAQIHPLLSRATHFAVHLPQTDQCALCDHFATPGQTSEEQFRAVEHYRSAYGSPILRNIPITIHCRAYDQVKAGDHTIFIGEVVEVEQQNSEASILYYNRSYRSVGEVVPDKQSEIKRAG